MARTTQIVVSVAAALAFGAAALAQAQSEFPGSGRGAGGRGPMMQEGTMDQTPGMHGRGRMNGPVAMLTKRDDNSVADMGLVMDLVHGHTQIKRTVTNLPDGIKTVTESDDPRIAQSIKAHVASMSGRLKDGREFNIFSTTLPVIFDHADKIQSRIDMTDKGVVVTRTSSDQKVVAALQAHATEVSELVRDGMAGMRRGMTARMAMGPAGPRASRGPVGTVDSSGSQAQHAH